jgi:nucleoside-diphosphate-sugar epimerase
MSGGTNQPVYLVTGAVGCIGSWVLYHLTRQGKRAVSFDLSADRRRVDLLLTPGELSEVTFITGDLTDAAQVLDAVRGFGVTHILHLAALQVPFCRANPALGAQVNVTGTVNVFEAARQTVLNHLVYASSVAVYGPPSPQQAGQVLHDAPLHPATLYGVYKVANENTARIYWQDHQISSTALRPYTIYGIGRDQGFTSGPTMAMLAAAAGRPYSIPFNGPCQYHFASDTALQFIAAVEQPLDGAYSFNMGGDPVFSTQIVDLIQQYCPQAQITCADAGLPFPAGFDDSPLRQAFSHIYAVPLEQGVQQTIEQFRALLAAGRIQME